MQPARRLNLLDLVLDARDAIADQATIGLDLGLAGAAHEAEAAALALQMGPGPHQTAALVIEMGEFDLQRALLRLGAAAEDFQNEAGAVEHLGVPFLLEVALLDRRQSAIHYHQLDVVAGYQAENFLDLALAEIGRGADLAERRRHGFGDGQADGTGEAGGFLEPRFGIADMAVRLRIGIAAPFPQIGTDDNHPSRRFTRRRPRSVGSPIEAFMFQLNQSHVGASSPPSNN